MERSISDHAAELAKIDDRAAAMAAEMSLIKIHLQHERTADMARDNVSQTVEARIVAIEQLIRATQEERQQPDPNSGGHDPVFEADAWARCHSNTSPPSGPPGAASATNALPTSAPKLGVSLTSVDEKLWNIDRKVSKELKACYDR